MKKGFTLVELLIVVVVIVTLMSITFRLAGSGGDSTNRNYTINRMQRLENCLSGYYAAYGSYPPVPLHGSRDYMVNVDAHGIQQVGNSTTGLKGSGSSSPDRASNLSWKRVQSACRSQPIGMSYPFKDRGEQDYVKKVSDMLIQRAQSDDPKYSQFRANAEVLSKGFIAITDESTLTEKRDYKEWTEAQIFRFGVMSFLLPRYLIMMGGDADYKLFENQKSWTANNQIPCRFEDGVQYESWQKLNEDVKQHTWKVSVLPSQAACARWLPNLEKTVQTTRSTVLYGTEIRDPDHTAANISASNPNPQLYSTSSQGGSGSNSGTQYALDSMTVVDGWGNEFYYYSPPPHQSYTLWSAGKNGKTFPPWVSDEELTSLRGMSVEGASGTALDVVQEWKADDIVKMSN